MYEKVIEKEKGVLEVRKLQGKLKEWKIKVKRKVNTRAEKSVGTKMY